MQLMRDKKDSANKILPLRVYKNIPEKNYLKSELEIIAIGIWNNDLHSYSHIHKFQLCFIFNDLIDKIIAIAEFEKGNLKNIQQEANKFGIAGKKVTMDISKVPKYQVIRALDAHFGRTKRNESFKSPDIVLREEFPSAFCRNQDLLYDVVRITDGMNISSSKEENTLNAGAVLDADGKYYGGNYSEHLNNNMLLRTLNKSDDEKFIPFHSFFISREIIKKAFDTLCLESYAQFLLWYFPEQRVSNDFNKHEKKIIREEIEFWSELKRSPVISEYNRAWRKKEKALNDLRYRIISILHEKK